MELALPPHGENYSRSRGESYARDAEMAAAGSVTPVYQR